MEIFEKYRSGIFLFSFSILCVFLPSVSMTNGVHTHAVMLSGSVVLDCGNSTNSERTWLFENKQININRNVFNELFKTTSFITKNYSLHIRNVSIEHEGSYQCSDSNVLRANHSVKVEVLLERVSLFSRYGDTNRSPRIVFVLDSYHFPISVIPTIHLTINNFRPVVPFVTVPRNASIIATCLASDARPPVNISWFVNNQKVSFLSIENQTISANRKNNKTFDTWSLMNFQPDVETGNITCVTNGLTEPGVFAQGVFQVENITFLEDRSTEYDKQISSSLGPTTAPATDATLLKTVLIITPSISFILILFFVVLCAVAKLKASKKSQIPEHQNETLEESSFATFDTDTEAVRVSQRSADYSRRLTLGLTTSPGDIPTDDPEYSFLPDFEGDFSSKLQDKTSKSRNYNANDLCLLLNMKMGPVYNKWMGTVAVDTDNTKSVVISTITDQTLRSKQIHWDEYVKRVLDLPNNKNLVPIVGISIDAVSLYLLHEHVVCETLERRVQTTRTVDSGKSNVMTPSQVLSYIRGILVGMELIHSYGFLHPGLTTKKILVTDEGACKLYDFCLSKDADKKVAIVKTQTVYNFNHFAPETLLRNAYTQACDVWSIGVVIWEIFSGGIPPFPVTEESISYSDKIPSLTDEWPEKYQRLKNRRVFDCWEEEVSLRPSLNQLRLSFSKIADSMEPCDARQNVTTSVESVEEYNDTQADDNTYE